MAQEGNQSHPYWRGIVLPTTASSSGSRSLFPTALSESAPGMKEAKNPSRTVRSAMGGATCSQSASVLGVVQPTYRAEKNISFVSQWRWLRPPHFSPWDSAGESAHADKTPFRIFVS